MPPTLTQLGLSLVQGGAPDDHRAPQGGQQIAEAAEVVERFVDDPMLDLGPVHTFRLRGLPTPGTLKVELEAIGFGTLQLSKSDYDLELAKRDLHIDAGLLIAGTVVRVSYLPL